MTFSGRSTPLIIARDHDLHGLLVAVVSSIEFMWDSKSKTSNPVSFHGFRYVIYPLYSLFYPLVNIQRWLCNELIIDQTKCLLTISWYQPKVNICPGLHCKLTSCEEAIFIERLFFSLVNAARTCWQDQS